MQQNVDLPETQLAGLRQVLRSQAGNLLAQCEAFTNILTKQQIETFPEQQEVMKELQSFEENVNMTQEEFKAAHMRIQEIVPKVRNIIGSMTTEQKKKFDKKAEKKCNKNAMEQQEKLQAQLNEVCEHMPPEHKLQLQEALRRMPIQKQEQMVAELIAKEKKRQQMTPEERAAEDADLRQLNMRFSNLMQSMDNQQKQMVAGTLQGMMPSQQLEYMRKLVEGGLDSLIPPTSDEVKEWKGVWLMYFNSEFSIKQGRRLPLKYCVKNPRPDEVGAAVAAIPRLKSIVQTTKRHPSDFLHPGRIMVKLFDNLGNLLNEDVPNKKTLLKIIGRTIANSKIRTTPELCAMKEKEGVFDMAAEEAQIQQAMLQMHGSPNPQQQSGPIKADKKKKRGR